MRRERAGWEIGRRRRVRLGGDRERRLGLVHDVHLARVMQQPRVAPPARAEDVDDDLLERVPGRRGRRRAWWRSFSTIRATQADSRGSISGTIELTGGIGSVAWRIRIAIAASTSWNGRCPVAARTRGSPRCRDRSMARRRPPSPARAPCRPACRSSSPSRSGTCPRRGRVVAFAMPKSAIFTPPVRAHEHVLGLEVAVHDPGLLRGHQPGQHALEHARDLRQRRAGRRTAAATRARRTPSPGTATPSCSKYS